MFVAYCFLKVFPIIIAFFLFFCHCERRFKCVFFFILRAYAFGKFVGREKERIVYVFVLFRMSENIVLRFDDVSFEYAHKKPLLDGASFSVRAGFKAALMGQNGAGKSTLFRLITRELLPTNGRISIESGARSEGSQSLRKVLP